MSQLRSVALSFVLPVLLGTTLGAQERLAIVRDDGFVTVTDRDRVLLRYRYEGSTHKPYVAELTSPSGTNVLRDAPADHLHHHGLMLAWSVDGVNFWEEATASGREVHAGWTRLEVVNTRTGDGPAIRTVEVATLRQRLRWQRPDGETLLDEDRVLEIPAARVGEPRVLTWRSTFSVPTGRPGTEIAGAAYNGLGARFVESMDRGGRFRNAVGGDGVPGTNDRPASWSAYTADPGNGESVTVAMFDASANPRHPATWFTMERPFAYLAATLGLTKEPVRLRPGEQFTLRYGIAVFDGNADRSDIDAAYARWQTRPREVRSGTARGLIGRYWAGPPEGRPAATRIDPLVAFDWTDGAPDDRLAKGRLSVEWTGELFVPQDGLYRFSPESDRGLDVHVDGRPVLRTAEPVGDPVKLERGYHTVRVGYHGTTDGARAKLLWQSDGFPREVIGARHLAHRVVRENEVGTTLAHERGRNLVELHACARCHDIPGSDATPKPGPPLVRGAAMSPEYLERWIRDPQTVRPGTRMPAITALAAKSGDEDVHAIVAFLRSLEPDREMKRKLDRDKRYRQRSASSFPSGSRNAGRRLFHELGCIACHAPEHPDEADPAEAPSLVDVGAKWSRGSLLRFLEAPLTWHPRGRMPDFGLTEMQAADLAAYLSEFRKLGDGTRLPAPVLRAETTDEHGNADTIARGRGLVERLRCAACHDIPGVDTPTARAPRLGVGGRTGRGCVAPRVAPGERRPPGEGIGLLFALPEAERAALVSFLDDRPRHPTPLASRERARRSVQTRFLCLRCHTRDGAGAERFQGALLRYLGEGASENADRPSIAEALVAPDLSGVGAKLKPAWLGDVLSGKAPSARPWLVMRMPRFAMDDHERNAIVDWLVATDSVRDDPGPKAPAHLPKNLAPAATKLLSHTGFACAACHHVGKHVPAGGTVGPDLAMVGRRISRAWFHRWLSNPERIRPGTPMPSFSTAVADVAGQDLLAQKEVLWRYLTTTPPNRIAIAKAPERVVPVPGDRPAVVQGRIRGNGPLQATRGVAIGFKDGPSLLFDGGRLSWLGHWTGGFLREVGRHGAHHRWVPSGKLLWTSSDRSPPIVFRERASGNWTAPPSWRDRFGWLDRVDILTRAARITYRLRAPGHRGADPFVGPWVTVVETVDPNPPGEDSSGYTRRIRITGLPPEYDAVVQIPGAAPAEESGALLHEQPTIVAQTKGGVLAVRAKANGAARWVTPPAAITCPVLQPFTDEPLLPDAVFDPESLPGAGRVAILLTDSGTSGGGEVVVQVSRHARASDVRSGPPRSWPGDSRPPPEEAPAYEASARLLDALERPGGVSAPAGYRVERLPLPDDFLVCALAFWRGKLIAGGYDGEIRIVEDADADGVPDQYRTFGGTLDQVNALDVFGDVLHACSPGAVYRIRDADHDGRADSYDILSSAWDWAGHPWDWTFGLARDRRGNLYASTSTPFERPKKVRGHHFRGSVLQITPDGRTVKVGDGTRYNFGWTSNRAGRIYFTGNQGHWNVTCTINQMQVGDHYGWGEPDQHKVKKPVLYVPYPWCRSLNGVAFAESARPFGVFQGHAFAADYNTRRVIRWTDQAVGSLRQGACYAFLEGIDAGPTDLAFGPDGALYVGFMSEGDWYPERARGGIYRVWPQPASPFAILEARTVADGFEITFTGPVDPASVGPDACRKVHRWFHEYKGVYHSEEIAHEDVPVTGMDLSSDRRTLHLRTGAHVTPRICEIQLRGITSASGASLASKEVYLTVHTAPGG